MTPISNVTIFVSLHSWCRDTKRDEAVRAAEDGRQGWLPTLDECIAMIPKIGSSTSAPEPENKGDDMGTKRDRQAADYRAETALEARTSTAGEGLRAAPAASEWRLLELGEIVKFGDEYLQSDGQWQEISLRHQIRAMDVGRFRRRIAAPAASGGGEGEPLAYFVKWGDKDWAVQDQTFRTLERAQDYIEDEKSEDEKPQIVPLYRAPPQPRGWLSDGERTAIEEGAEILYQRGSYASSNRAALLRGLLTRVTDTEPRGWLTEEERELIAGIADDDEYTEDGQNIAKGLLARSSPPEVVAASRMTPAPGDDAYQMSYIEGFNDAGTLWRASIEDSGVAVKEVGRE